MPKSSLPQPTDTTDLATRDAASTPANETSESPGHVSEHPGKAPNVPLILLFALVLALIVSNWFLHQRVNDLLANQGPQLASFNLAQMVTKLPADLTPEELEKVMLDTRQVMSDLSAAGYLVIDGEAVLARPEGIVIDVDDVLSVVMEDL